MATFAVYIEKRMRFKGTDNTFGNTYHYEQETTDPFQDVGVINAVADAEAAIMDQSVEFVRGTTWGPTDGPEVDNVIRETVELDQVAAFAAPTTFAYRTCALLVSWPMPRTEVLNRRRWLRKFIRPVGGLDLTSEQKAGVEPVPQEVKDFVLSNYAEPIRVVTLSTATLANEQGVEHNGAPFVGDFVTTRQVDK